MYNIFYSRYISVCGLFSLYIIKQNRSENIFYEKQGKNKH